MPMKQMYNTRTFGEVFTDPEEGDSDVYFLNEWKASGLYKSGLISDSVIKIIFWLLYAKYGNNPISNYDENQFKAKVFAIIYSDGPVWAKRREIQEELTSLNLSSSDIYTGIKNIHNASYNPSTSPGTSSLEELTTINTQNVDITKKGKIEGLTQLWNILQNDPTDVFINKFKSLFLTVVKQRPYIFETLEEEEDE